jgi:MYND finger/Ankyrin repeats (3 copies)/Ankyrin repeats (many copies)/Ankyrin repeat
MAQRDTALAAMRRAEPAVAAGADLYAATGFQFRPSECIVDACRACAAECPNILAALIEKYGVDVNSVVDNSWETLLIASALFGSTKCIAVLLSHGADVNLAAVCEGDLFSPLLAAAQNGHVAVCRLLVEAGADLEFRGDLQMTPLHYAAQFGKVGVAALLMQRGANTRAMDSDLRTPIMVACNNQQLLCVRTLLSCADLAHRDKYGSSLLHLAAVKGGPAVLEAVLPRYIEAGLVDIPSGVDADNKAPAGRTPLMSACLSANYAEAKMLLKAGASRYAKELRGICPLHFCLDGASMACLQLLLGTAPNWHYTPEQLNHDTDGCWPALAAAVQWGSAEACNLIIAAGADASNVLYKGAIVGYADVARIWWPEKPELAAVFDPGAVQESFTPPCCAHCQKSGIKLRACSKCHAAQYCSTACQRAHWRAHKLACISTKDVHDANFAKYNTQS